MIELTGINLSERHHEFNKKVNTAFKNNDNFEEIIKHEEKSDVDRLFKIDLANLNNNVNYLEETLKCGDPLYISRALKCSHLFDAVHIINPDYVHKNIFPFMSSKMKKKMLTAIASNVQDEERINNFYEYCLSHQLKNMADKFLINTSQQYKEDYLKTHIDIDDSIKYEFFFGTSYELIDKHLHRKKSTGFDILNDLFRFSYLYSYSSDKYLDMLEYNLDDDKRKIYDYRRFGLRISKCIMTKHKDRVLNKLWLYLGLLDKKVITKYSSYEDAKTYAIALMPDTSENFWSRNMYEYYGYVFEKIPASELYMFLKQLFSSKYPNALFEMDFSFYRLQYYKLMTPVERHEWALNHIEQKKEHFGSLRDYLWYEFVQFNKAFYEIKRYIYVNKSHDIRSELIDVLIKSASSQNDLVTLVTYYYERHVNEARHHKKTFVNNIVDIHNVYKFSENCWTVFLKLLHSLEVFATIRSSRLAMLAIVYNIIHYKLIPENLEPFCKFEDRRFNIDLEKLDSEEKELVYSYLKEFFANKIKGLMEKNTDEDVKERIISYAWSVITLIDGFKKTKDECPEVVMENIKLNWDEFRYYKWFTNDTKTLTEGDLLRLLKKDKDLLLQEISDVKYFDIRCTNLLKKIRVYFYNDVAKRMIDFYDKKLLELYKDKNNYIDFSPLIFNLIQLSDTKYKLNLLSEYAPIEPKIKHDEIDRNLLKIQEAICRFTLYSRPPVPLAYVQKYIQGDYVPFCLPMFNSYLNHLPLPLSLEFIKAMLDAPVSIQKHGLRSAFMSFEIDSLKELIVKVWNTTRNMSLRLVLYKALVDKIRNVNESDQTKLYEALKMFTLDLDISDQDEIFDLLTSTRLPDRFYGDFLVSAWKSVNNLPYDSTTFINRKTRLIQHITTFIAKVDRTFCRNVIDDHFDTMFKQTHILYHDNTYQISTLYEAKWIFTATYISQFNNEEELKNSLELLQKIMRSCCEIWDEVRQDTYVVRKFLYDFLNSVGNCIDYSREIDKKTYIVPIFECIVTFFQEHLPINKIIIFGFKLAVLCRNALGDGVYDPEDKRITYKHLVNENVARDIAKAIDELVNDKYYPSLCESIAELIRNNVDEVTRYTNLKSSQLIISVSHNLSKSNNYYNNLLALHILPLNVFEECENDFFATIDMIMSKNNEDLNSFLYNKFIKCDFKNRLALRM